MLIPAKRHDLPQGVRLTKAHMHIGGYPEMSARTLPMGPRRLLNLIQHWSPRPPFIVTSSLRLRWAACVAAAALARRSPSLIGTLCSCRAQKAACPLIKD